MTVEGGLFPQPVTGGTDGVGAVLRQRVLERTRRERILAGLTGFGVEGVLLTDETVNLTIMDRDGRSCDVLAGYTTAGGVQVNINESSVYSEGPSGEIGIGSTTAGIDVLSSAVQAVGRLRTFIAGERRVVRQGRFGSDAVELMMRTGGDPMGLIAHLEQMENGMRKAMEDQLVRIIGRQFGTGFAMSETVGSESVNLVGVRLLGGKTQVHFTVGEKSLAVVLACEAGDGSLGETSYEVSVQSDAGDVYSLARVTCRDQEEPTYTLTSLENIGQRVQRDWLAKLAAIGSGVWQEAMNAALGLRAELRGVDWNGGGLTREVELSGGQWVRLEGIGESVYGAATFPSKQVVQCVVGELSGGTIFQPPRFSL